MKFKTMSYPATLCGIFCAVIGVADAIVTRDHDSAKLLLVYSFSAFAIQGLDSIRDELKLLRTDFVLNVRGKLTTESTIVSEAPTQEKSDAK